MLDLLTHEPHNIVIPLKLRTFVVYNYITGDNNGQDRQRNGPCRFKDFIDYLNVHN